MRLKHKLKQFTAIALSCLSVVSTPLTAYAVGGNTGAGDNEGIHGGYGSDMGSNRENSRLGFRVSLVDRNDPTKVISVDDEGNPLVVDFLLANEETYQRYTGYSTDGVPTSEQGWRSNLEYVYKASRMQDYTTNNKIEIVPENEYVNEVFGGKRVPQWNESKGSILYGGNGTAFKEFFTDGLESDGTIYAVSSSGKLTILKEAESVNIRTEFKDKDGQKVNFSLENPKISNERDLKAWMEYYVKKWTPDIENWYKGIAGVDMASMAEEDKYVIYKEYLETLHEFLNSLDLEVVNRNQDWVDDKFNEALDSMGNQIAEGGRTASIKGILNKFNPFNPMTVYAAGVDGGNSNIGSDEAGGSSGEGFEQVANTANIQRLLGMVSPTKTGYLLQTPSMLEKAGQGIESDKNTLLQAEEDWVCFVEPLFYCSLFAVDDDSKPRVNKFYGTLSNFYQFVNAPDSAFRKAFGDKALTKVASTMNWKFYNSAGSYASIVLENPLTNRDGSQVFLQAPKSLKATASLQQINDVFKTEGYGVHAYDKGLFADNSTTVTWDDKNFPNSRGPAPDESTSEEDSWDFTKKTQENPEPGTENLERKFNISKFYYVKAGNQYTLIDTQTREETLHNVGIMNEGSEGEEFLYEVVGWSCGKDKIYPDSGDLSKGFDYYIQNNPPANPNKNQGNSQGILKLDPKNELDKKEQVLYVMLVREKVEKDEVDIVRVYETPNQTPVIEVEPNVKVENNVVDGSSPKPGFTYVENVNTSEPRKDITSWDEVPGGTSGRTPQIPVSETDKTIYIKYEGAPVENPQATGLVLHENEISHQFKLSDVTGSLVEGVQNWSSVSSDASCPEDVGDEDDYESCGASYDYTGSEDWSFGIENKPSYNTQFVYKWAQLEPKSWTGGGLSEDGGSGKGTPNMTMILQRSISDKVTLYPNMNSNKAALNDMGITSEGYQPANTRKDSLKDVPSRKSWNETFNTNFNFVNVNTPTAYFESDHGYTDTDNHTDAGNNASSLNGTYSQSGNTTIYGLWGKENKGVAPLTDTAQQNIWKLSTLNFKGFKNHIKEQSFTFYPYYKMKFISELDGAEQDAYLTAENLSTLF